MVEELASADELDRFCNEFGALQQQYDKYVSEGAALADQVRGEERMLNGGEGA